MTSHQIAAEYSESILTTISGLQNDILATSQAQDALLEVISKVQVSMISEEELNTMKENMDKVSTYNTKLMSLKATMSMLAGRSKQLKERASKLEQLKLKYLSEIDTIRELEKAKDQVIAASVSTPTIPTPSSPSPSPSPVAIPKIVKKKKKSKARQALIDEDDDNLSWKPKRSINQKDFKA